MMRFHGHTSWHSIKLVKKFTDEISHQVGDQLKGEKSHQVADQLDLAKKAELERRKKRNEC